MGIGTARASVRLAVEQGRSLDWVDENVIERSGLTTLEKGALYLYAFAMLPATVQARVVRESFALATTQVAHLN